MALVFKIKIGETLRRMTFPGDGPSMTYSGLEKRIRDLFKISEDEALTITYTDKDNDVVTMGGDQDLADACFFQGLNPLRLNVTLSTGKVAEKLAVSGIARAPAAPGIPQEDILTYLKRFAPEPNLKLLEQHWKEWSKGLAPPAESLKQLINNYDLFMRASTCPNLGALKGVEGAVAASHATVAGAVEIAAEDVAVASQRTGKDVEFASSNPPEDKFFVKQGSSTISDLTLSASPSPMSASGSPSPGPVLELVDVDDKGQAHVGNDNELANRTFHNFVQCDGCGMSPIVGPRFKSTKKQDFDLCSSCFKESGNSNDYSRIDRPLFRPRHMHPAMYCGRMMRCPVAAPAYSGRPFAMRGPYHGGKSDCRFGGQMHGAGGKLDARFVQDVTIFDGTELAPGTHFTKIWRLRNSGTLPWPQHTKLVHVGGDELGSVFAVSLQLREQGLAPDQEIEASVDLTAPEKPGRYVSHWRLASPSGPKFGHRVWVLIQVVQKETVLVEDEFVSVSKGVEDAEQVSEVRVSSESDVAEAGPAEEAAPSICSSVEEVVGSVVSPNAVISGLDTNTEVDEFLNSEKSNQDDTVVMESSELGGFEMMDMPFRTPGTWPSLIPPIDKLENVKLTDVPVESRKEEGVVNVDTSSESLLEQLEAMGFHQTSLNLELLTKNNFDLRRTLDDLFAAAEWDPILEELEEMGFYDVEMNRRLMFKNNGSVKMVVKELVQMYKEPGKGKAVAADFSYVD